MLLLFVIVIFLLIIIIMLLESNREFKDFKITEYTINDKNLPDAFDGFRFAVIGDLHNAQYGKNNIDIIEALRRQKPQAVILAGDMVLCRDYSKEDNLHTAQFIKILADEFEVYYGIGNHERGIREKKDEVGDVWNEYIKLLPPDVNILSDDKVRITLDNDTICICGLDIDRRFYKRIKNIPMSDNYIESKLGKKEEYTILIAHNPDYFIDYVKWGANIIISGHIHGGMIRLPILGGVISPKLKLFPKYDYGHFINNDKHMLVTGGLGAHFPKIRINNKPEILMVNLTR